MRESRGTGAEPLTSVGIWIGVVQLERHPFDEIAQVICTTDNVRVWRRRRAPHGDSPTVSVVCGHGLALFVGQDSGGISIYYRTVYRHSL